MNWLRTSLAITVFSTAAMGQQFKLDGRLITDQGATVPNIRVRVGSEHSVTDANGRFSIHPSSKLREGERVVIVVEKKDWLINQPLDGEWKLPATGSQNLQILDVIIVPWGSRALLTMLE